MYSKQPVTEQKGFYKVKNKPKQYWLVGRVMGCFLFSLLLLNTVSYAENTASSRLYNIDIPASNAADALNLLAEQADAVLLFPYRAAKTRQANKVVGRYTLIDALNILLKRSGLVSSLSDNGTIHISTVEASAFNLDSEGMGMTSKKNLLASTIAFFLGSGVAPGVFAQADEAAAQRSQIDEIIVTATKRGAGTSIQDTAMAISALSGDTIEKRGLVGMGDYLQTLPGVSMQDRGASQNTIIIRGIGSDPQVEDSTVGIYFGETPVTGLGSSSVGDASGSADLKMVDIEGVEVLRGPQGTLYGSGSMGGTVRIIPASPNLEQVEGRVAASYSQTGEQGGDNSMVQAVVNVPLIEDTLAIRAVAYQFDNSGYIDNVAASQPNAAAHIAAAIAATGVVRDESEIGSDQYTGFRLSALWQPIDDLGVTLMHASQEIEQDGFPEVNLSLPDNFQQVRLAVGPGGTRSEFMGNEIDITNLVVKYDLGWASLHSSSSWINYEALNEAEISLFFFTPYYGSIESGNDVFVEELRLVSDLDGSLQFLLGLYYEDNELTSSAPFLWGGDVSLDSGNPIAGTDIHGSTEQKALFGELTYSITEELSATFGLRHFEYDQRFEQYSVFLGTVGTDSDDSKNVSDQNYKFNLTYTPNEDLMIYGQWAEGFRLGKAIKTSATCDADSDGFLDDVGFADPGGVGPDIAESFELGIKTSLADNRVTVNAALYRINWEGMPVSLPLPSCGGLVTINAGESKSEGVELEVQARLTENLQLDFSTSYGESTLTEDAVSIGFAGDNLPGSSDFNASVGIEYGFVVAGRDAFTRIDYTYLSEYYHNVAETGEASGGYGHINLKAGIDLDQIELNLFVNNLTNGDDFTWVESVLGPFGGNSAYRLRPRTVGMNLAYRF